MNLAKKLVLLAAVATMVFGFGQQQARADIVTYFLTVPNSGLNGGVPANFATVDVDLTSATMATITFTAFDPFRMTDGGAAGVNVNAAHWSASTSQMGLTQQNAGNEDGFGNFNLKWTVGNSGPSSVQKVIQFTVTNTNGGTWGAASQVLINNNDGYLAAAHIGILQDVNHPGLGIQAQTGFAANGDRIPPQETPDGGTTLTLLGCGLVGVEVLRRKLAV